MNSIVIPDFVNTLAQANQAAAQTHAIRQQNALAGYYRDNAQGLMSGDQNALAGLAQYDPQTAFSMQRQLQEDQQRAAERAEAQAWRQDERQYQRGRAGRQDARADQEWQFKLEEYAAQKSAAEREAEAAQIEQAVQQGLALPDAATWDQVMAQQAPDLVGQFDNRENIARGYLSIAEQLKGSGAGFRPATAEEAARYGAAAGQYGPDGRFYPVNPPSGFSVETGPDGSSRIIQGPGVSGAKPLNENQSKLALFENMQAETVPVLNGLEEKWNPANMSDAAAARVPIAGNFWKSQEAQIYNSAAAAWAEGALRIATGAAAQDAEIQRMVRTYFATPGDTPETVAFKRKMRDMYGRSIGLAQGDAPSDERLTVPGDAPAEAAPQTSVPDFTTMSDDELADWIAKNGG